MLVNFPYLHHSQHRKRCKSSCDDFKSLSTSPHVIILQYGTESMTKYDGDASIFKLRILWAVGETFLHHSQMQSIHLFRLFSGLVLGHFGANGLGCVSSKTFIPSPRQPYFVILFLYAKRLICSYQILKVQFLS